LLNLCSFLPFHTAFMFIIPGMKNMGQLVFAVVILELLVALGEAKCIQLLCRSGAFMNNASSTGVSFFAAFLVSCAANVASVLGVRYLSSYLLMTASDEFILSNYWRGLSSGITKQLT
jgi:hypothetical protein